jgi:hypothetical protein
VTKVPLDETLSSCRFSHCYSRACLIVKGNTFFELASQKPVGFSVLSYHAHASLRNKSMEVLIKPLYAVTSVGLEDNLIDVVVMRMILQKAQEQQAVRLRNLEALSHFENFDDFRS